MLSRKLQMLIYQLLLQAKNKIVSWYLLKFVKLIKYNYIKKIRIVKSLNFRQRE